ncbi:MAG: DUF4440 domain-containing protein [Planctomyces sp.]|nr:DUF4440 domain-containing protein [Planctomyces sp.]
MSGHGGTGGHADELAIRTLQYLWMQASGTGDLELLKSLMTEDVVFLTPGRPPLSREAFLAACEQNRRHMHIEATGHLEEIVIVGDVAYTRTLLGVKVTSLASGGVKRLSGYVMSVFRKEPGGPWRLARDANLLTPEASTA